MKELRSPWSVLALILALGNMLGCEALQGRQAPNTIDSPLAVTGSTLDFGTIVVGSTGYLSETIANRGTVTATVQQATVTNPEFRILRPKFPLTLRPGAGARILISFTPRSAGSPTGVIAIAGARQSTTVTIRGTAVLPGRFSAAPASMSFGRVFKGKTQVRMETFTNTGSTNITVSQASVSSSAFQLAGPSLPLVLGPSQSAVFKVAFTPQTIGTVRAELSVTSSASLVAANRGSINAHVRRRGNSASNAVIPLAGTGVGQGILAASPMSVAFGSAKVGSSMTKSVALANSGTSALQVTQATVSGAGFQIAGTNAPITLQPGQSTSLNIVFSPPAAGNQNGSLTIVTDGPTPVTLISLSGNSPVPASGTLTVNAASLSFGSVQVGETKTQSGILTNSGSSAVTISQANVSGNGFGASGMVLPLKLDAGQSSAFTITYAPSAPGTSNGTLALTSDASNPTLAISLSATATAAPGPGVLHSSLSSLNFGDVQVGSTKTQPETLTNSGGSAITISQASLSGSGFSIGGLALPAKLNPGQSASLAVTYSPTSEGANSAVLTLASDASNATVTVSLSGTATAVPSPAVLAQGGSNLAFGSVQVGTTTTKSQTLSNTGGSSATISDINVTGAGFSVSATALPLKLAAGQTVALTVTYSPTAAGNSTGALVIVSDASNSSLTTSLSGTAIAPPDPGVLGLSPSTLNFGSVQVGDSKSQNETLKNSGGSVVSISQASVAGTGFTVSGLDLPLQLNAGESFTFSVVFAPTSAGSGSGKLSFISDASNTLPAVSLSGSGAAAGQLAISPSSLSFGSVLVGSSKTLNTTLSAVNSSVTVSSAVTGDPEFTLSGASFPLTLSAGESVTLTLTFSPQSSGSASSSLSLATNALNASATQLLAGTGVTAPHHSVVLSWDGSSPAYYVYRGTTPGGPYAKLSSSLASTSYTDTSVQSGSTYFYVTTSMDNSGKESDYSNEVTASIPTP